MNIYKQSLIKVQELFESAYSFFTQTYKAKNKQFTKASAWGQLLQSQHELTELNLFYIEDALTELNPQTALRHDSIRGLSTLTGHNPYFGNAANGVISLNRSYEENTFTTHNLVIPNNTKIICKNNGIEYSINLDTDYIIINNDFSGILDLRIFQGEKEYQTETGTGETLQSFNFLIEDGFYIDQDDLDVFVNDEKWMRVNSLLEMSYNSKEYYVLSSVTGGFTIFFGNGQNGAIPTLGSTIKFQYIKHNGVQGNLEVDNPVFAFNDEIYDTLGNEVEINKIFNIKIKEPILFGANVENIELTRRMFNRIDRSNVLYTPTSFELFFEKFNLFSTIRAFKKINDNILQDDNIVYIMLIPNITKRIKYTTSYYNIPLEYFRTTDQEKIKIQAMIESSGRKPSQVEIVILDPTIKRYIVNIKIILHEKYKLQNDIIKEKIKNLLAEYFINNKRFDRIPRSDIIRIIEDINGVDSVSVYFKGEENELNKIKNPGTNELIGLDEFNDIILNNDEVAVLRGGWVDANGVEYSDDINDPISMINIMFK